MKKDLLKLISIASMTALIIGCGSSGTSIPDTSDSGSNSSPGTSSPGAGDSNPPATGEEQQEEPQVNPRKCTYHVPANQTLNVGDEFNATSLVATALDGLGKEVTVVTTGIEDVNTSKAGKYTITFSSDSCDNSGRTIVTVQEVKKEEDTTPALDPKDLLPF
jgi:hypothetical protein